LLPLHFLRSALKTRIGKVMEGSKKLYVSKESQNITNTVLGDSCVYLVDLVDRVLPVPALEFNMVSTLS